MYHLEKGGDVDDGEAGKEALEMGVVDLRVGFLGRFVGEDDAGDVDGLDRRLVAAVDIHVPALEKVVHPGHLVLTVELVEDHDVEAVVLEVVEVTAVDGGPVHTQEGGEVVDECSLADVGGAPQVKLLLLELSLLSDVDVEPRDDGEGLNTPGLEVEAVLGVGTVLGHLVAAHLFLEGFDLPQVEEHKPGILLDELRGRSAGNDLSGDKRRSSVLLRDGRLGVDSPGDGGLVRFADVHQALALIAHGLVVAVLGLAGQGPRDEVEVVALTHVQFLLQKDQHMEMRVAVLVQLPGHHRPRKVVRKVGTNVLQDHLLGAVPLGERQEEALGL